MEQNAKSLADYLDIARRRKYYIIIPFILISIASVVVAYYLPKTYRSAVTLLMETPIPKNVVESSSAEFAEEQIRSITQKVLTMDSVLKIIDSNGLYADYRDALSSNDLVELFKSNTEIKLAESKFGPRGNGVSTSMAFIISFNYHEPVKDKDIVDQLAALFIEQNDRGRTQSAKRATEFLMTESGKLENEIRDLDNQIADYKKQYKDSLPEQQQGNLATLDRKETELRDTEQQIRLTQERITFLTAELARPQFEIPVHADDKAPLSRDEELRRLQRQYLNLSSKYSSSHPDVVRIKRQIAALDPHFQEQPSEDDIRSQLAEAKRTLRSLETKYDSSHPDIARLKGKIGKLQSRQYSSERTVHGVQESGRRMTNPAYLNVELQLKASQGELMALIQKKEYLRATLEKLQNRITLAPEVEKHYLELIRERDRTLSRLNELKEKLLDAKLVETMEKEQHGQTLTIIEQPIVPIRPEKAIRRKVALGGIFLGLAVGLGSALLVEFLDPRLRGYQAFREVTGLMPLVVFPYIETPSELEQRFARQHKNRKLILWIIIACCLLAITMSGLYFYPFVRANGFAEILK